jgi:hypothetical protein
LQNAVAISQHVGIPEAENTITLRCKPSITLDVGLGFRVLAAVDLDYKATLMTGKVDDERADECLTSEAQAIQSMRSQCRPKALLGVCHVMPQRFRATAMNL